MGWCMETLRPVCHRCGAVDTVVEHEATTATRRVSFTFVDDQHVPVAYQEEDRPKRKSTYRYSCTSCNDYLCLESCREATLEKRMKS